MSALRDLTAAHGERRKAVQAALKDLSTAVLETQTTLAMDEALKRTRDAARAMWDAGHRVDNAMRRESAA